MQENQGCLLVYIWIFWMVLDLLQCNVMDGVCWQDLSVDQLQRMERSRQLALERRAARLRTYLCDVAFCGVLGFQAQHPLLC